MKVNPTQGRRVQGPESRARVPLAHGTVVCGRGASGGWAKMCDRLEMRRRGQREAGRRAQGDKGQPPIGDFRKRWRKNKAIQTFGMRLAWQDRGALCVDPHQAGGAIRAKFNQHRAFCRTRSTWSGQDQGKGQHKATKGLGELFHRACLTESGR